MAIPVRILQITYTGGTGGVSVLIRELVEYLQAKQTMLEIEVCYVSSKGTVAQEVEALGTTVYCLGAKNGFDIVRIFKLWKIIKNGKYDIVHLHSFTPLVRLIVYLAKPKQFIMTEHGGIKGEMYSKRWIIMKLIHRMLKNSADVYTAVSRDSRTDLLSHNLAPEAQLKTIHNGIRIDKFEFSVERRKLNRKEWKINDSEIVVGTVRSLTSKMGIDHLIIAGQEILKTLPNVKFVIVGDGPLRKSLMRMTYQSGMEKKVIFLGQRRDIAGILSAFDIFVMPSVWETFGIAAAEAMAIGLPVVAYDVGGLKEVVVDGVTGLLVRDRNPAHLTNAIIELVTNSAKRRLLGQNGRRIVGERFGFETTAEQYVSLYESLLNECTD